MNTIAEILSFLSIYEEHKVNRDLKFLISWYTTIP